MKQLRWFNYRIYRFHKWLVAAIFLALFLLSSVQVVLRIFFHTGIANAETLLRYLVLWAAFTGAVLATYKNRHINLDVISKMLKKWHPFITGFLVSVFSLVIISFMADAAVRFIINEYNSSTERVFFIPVWLLETVIPGTFIFMAIIFLQNAIDSALKLFAGREK